MVGRDPPRRARRDPLFRRAERRAVATRLGGIAPDAPAGPAPRVAGETALRAKSSTKTEQHALPAWALAAGDAAAIALFAVIGLANHKEGITASGLARNVLPILGAWVVVAPIMGTYRNPSPRSMLMTWIIAVPVGVAIRAIVLHREADGSQVVFGIITLITTGLLLLGWRGVAALATRRERGALRRKP